MVAICDVDDHKLGTAGQHRFKKAKKFNDFRKMLDEMGKSIDAVTVSTPDHVHALAAAMAMKMKKHCFVQKPLTHSIHEARVLGQLARENGVATQMGNQGTANNGLRKAAAAVQAGVLGTVKEVHVWTNRPIWPQGGNRPAAAEPPKNLHWDLWLGPAPRAALRQRLSSVQLARLVGFRLRRAGRHGLPHLQHALRRARSPRSDLGAGRDLRP